MTTSHGLALFIVASMTGCMAEASAPAVGEAREWPCGSIETGGYLGLANIHERYQYDDLHNIVWQQKTNFEQGSNYGKVMSTETKTFEGKVAVAEELVADVWHDKTTRELVGGRIVRETHVQYGFQGSSDVTTTSNWTYDGDRVTRIDHQDATTGGPRGYTVFTYPDNNTRVRRDCWADGGDGSEDCSIETLVGGTETWTTRTTDMSADGDVDFKDVRTLDANGLPLTIEFYSSTNGTLALQGRTVIERRADGAPLFMDEGFTQTEYLFSCE